MNLSMKYNMMMKPVAFVKNQRTGTDDDNWGPVESVIELADYLPEESLERIDTFSHLEVIYYFHRSVQTVTGSEHPRGNSLWPKVGIFAQRKKDRPNHIGTTIVRLIKRDGRKLLVQRLDAIDGTPVLDIKPVMTGFIPAEEIKQPSWALELMKNYW